MSTPIPPPPPSEDNSLGPWQFSLKGMLLMVTAVAVGLTLLTLIPSVGLVLLVGIAWGLLPAGLLTLVVYARGPMQAFGIGALAALLCSGLGFAFSGSAVALLGAPIASLLGGLAAHWTLGRIRQWGWDQQES